MASPSSRRRGTIRADSAARPYLGRRLQPLVLVPRQRAGARGDARGVPLSRHPGRHGHGHRQRRPARGLRDDRAGTARGLRGRRAQPPRRRHRAPARDRRALSRRRRQGSQGAGPRLARLAGRQAHRACAGQRHHRIYRGRHRGSAARSQAPARRDRRPADGGHERRRRPVRRRQDVPAAGGQVGARDEAGGGDAAALYGGGEDGQRRRRPPERRQDPDGDRQGRRARHRQEHRRRRARLQQLRDHRPRRDDAGLEDPRTSRASERPTPSASPA